MPEFGNQIGNLWEDQIDEEQAELLGVKPGDAALYIERRGFLDDGRVIEATESWYRGDAYDFVAELNARA